MRSRHASPGIKDELPDQDAVLTYLPKGAVVGSGPVGDSGGGESSTGSDKEADQHNYVAGIHESLQGRSTKASVSKNVAGESAYQANLILDAKSFGAWTQMNKKLTQ
jgi:hypothetical protein